MRATEFTSTLNLTEFAPGSGDDSGGDRDEVFVLAPMPSDRTKFKVRITDFEAPEEFMDSWNHVHPVYQKFFNNKYPFWNAMHPLFSKLPVIDMNIEEYVLGVGSALLRGLEDKIKSTK